MALFPVTLSDPWLPQTTCIAWWWVEIRDFKFGR